MQELRSLRQPGGRQHRDQWNIAGGAKRAFQQSQGFGAAAFKAREEKVGWLNARQYRRCLGIGGGHTWVACFLQNAAAILAPVGLRVDDSDAFANQFSHALLSHSNAVSRRWCENPTKSPQRGLIGWITC